MLLLPYKFIFNVVMVVMMFTILNRENNRVAAASFLTDFFGVIPEEVLPVFRNPPLYQDIVRVLFVFSSGGRD